MHSSSQEQRATHIRFSQEEEGELEEGAQHGASSGSMKAETSPTNGTKSALITGVSSLPPPQQSFAANTRPLPPPQQQLQPSRPAAKSTSLFRSKPPAKPMSIDVQNYRSVIRRAENPLYANVTPTVGEGAGVRTAVATASEAVREPSAGSVVITKPAKFEQQKTAPSLNQTRMVEQERQYSARPPPSPSRSITSPNWQSPHKQRHFAIPPKSPHQPRMSFGSPSPSPRKGNKISVPAPNSTSWVGEDAAPSNKVKDDKEVADEVAQVRIPDVPRRAAVTEDKVAKPTVGTTKAASVGMVKQPAVAVWLKQDVKELIDSVASKVSVTKRDEDDDEDGFGADWLDEKSLSELAKDLDDLDEKEKEDDFRKREMERERERERERVHGRNRDLGPQRSGKESSGRAVQARERERREKQSEKKLMPEPDFPYSDDEERNVQEMEPVTLVSVPKDTIAKKSGVNMSVVKEYTSKENTVKSRDHVRERELELEHEWRQRVDRDRDGQRNGSSTVANSSQERKKSAAVVSRRLSFLPSDISSGDDDSLQSPGRLPPSNRPGNGTSSSGKASQEGTKKEVKAIPLSFSLSAISSDDELQPIQRQQQASKLSKKPESKTPLEDILRNRSSIGQDNRPSTPTRSIYNPKNSNLNRSIDAPDSDSDLDDAPFSITATQSQSNPHTQSSLSTSGSRPLSQALSVTSMDSFSSTIARTSGSRRERETERIRKRPTSFIDVGDGSLDDDDNPFLEHTIPRTKSVTSSNKVKDEPGSFDLKKRKEEYRNFVDSCRHQDKQQREQHKRDVQKPRDKDDIGFDESTGKRKQVDSSRTHPSRPEKAAEEILRLRNINGTEDTRQPRESSVRHKKRTNCGGDEDDRLGNDADTSPRHSVGVLRGRDTPTVTHKERSAIPSADKERTRRTDEHRAIERDYSNSQEDRDWRKDRDRELAGRPRMPSVERTTGVTIKQEQPLDDPFSVLLTPSNSQRRTPKADQIWSGKKRRTHPGSTSGEESDSSCSRATTPEPATRTTAKNLQERPPSTPTKGVGGKKSDFDGIKRQGLKSPRKSPRFGDDFKLPSPRRKRIRSIAELMSLSDDDYPSTDAAKEGEVLCPYCGDTLPTMMSTRLKSSLAKILTRQEERLQARQDLLRRERMQDAHLDSTLEPSIAEPQVPSTTTTCVATPKKSWVPRPRKLERLKTIPTLTDSMNDAPENDDDVAAGSEFFAKEDEQQQRLFGKISAVEKFEFCRIHVAEDKIIPAGLERNYPLFIRFDELPDRIRRMEPELLGIIRGTVASPYLDLALANYRKLGHGARNPQAVLAGVQLTLPGYYGSKGSSRIAEVLVKMFIETEILTNEAARPQGPIEFIQQVLVPETGIRLILEDRRSCSVDGGEGEGDASISVEEAQAIMLDSVEFGNYVHDIELPW